MGQANESKGIWQMNIVKYVLIASITLFVTLILIYGFTETGIRQLIRWSARISVVLFCSAFAASSIHEIMKNSFSWWLSMNRKYFGISFALIHLMHLGFIILLQLFFHPVFNLAKPTSLMAGGIAYLFVIIMLFTSFKKYAKFLSKKQWKIIHWIGGHWIWAIFVSTNIKHVDEPLYWIPLGLLSLTMLVRIYKLFRK